MVQRRRALGILRNAEGPGHLSVSLAEYRLAQALMLEKKYAGAEPLLRHALNIQEGTYRHGHRMIAAKALEKRAKALR